ncbi:hypothetical protein L1994_10670 [Methanomicrobium antiquum]|uniref:Uncharacterized protein n=1 Tax=Methanomicrobium antiquum TaxID=487686 RepID=A0AAF0FL92_9EURY|nr:hypothetical protein [Methanomicrobium antiquum]WFN36588.1 hypothetical protein L1994_10670 [Methanomicrobium antiquum]
MKLKKGMRALSLLMVMALLGAIFVPAVSAENETMECPLYSKTGCDEFVKIGNINLPLTKSDIFQIDSKKYDKPMTKAQFEEENAEYIKFLYSQFGDQAKKMIDHKYSSSVGDLTKVSTTTSIIHIGSNDMYLWPCINAQTSTSASEGQINVIFFDKTVDEVKSILSQKGWGNALGWSRWGLHGSNLNNMIWTKSVGEDAIGSDQVEDGSYFGNRYHLVLIDGHHSSSINDDWCYGDCHYEIFTGLGHEPMPDSENTGRDHLYSDLLNEASASWIYLQNPWDGFFDGWGYIFDF